MFLMPSDAHRTSPKQFEPKKKKITFVTIPKNFSPRSPSSIFPASVHITSPLLQLPRATRRKVTHRRWDRGLKTCGHVPTALRLLRSPKQFTRILQKDEEKAVTKLQAALPCQQCTVRSRWGCLFIASGTGFRSAFRHFSVGVYRAPVDTVREALPNSIFTSIATIRADTLHLKKRDIISKA